MGNPEVKSQQNSPERIKILQILAMTGGVLLAGEALGITKTMFTPNDSVGTTVSAKADASEIQLGQPYWIPADAPE